MEECWPQPGCSSSLSRQASPHACELQHWQQPLRSSQKGLLYSPKITADKDAQMLPLPSLSSRSRAVNRSIYPFSRIVSDSENVKRPLENKASLLERNPKSALNNEGLTQGRFFHQSVKLPRSNKAAVCGREIKTDSGPMAAPPVCCEHSPAEQTRPITP